MELSFSIFFEIFHLYGLVATGLSDRGTSAGLRGVQGVQLYRARAVEGPAFKPNVTRIVLKNATFDRLWQCVSRNGRIRAVKFRPKKFPAKFCQFGWISPKSANFWLKIGTKFAQIKRNSPTNFGAKLNCADSPVFGRTRITVENIVPI
jgi:hypothetical protein